MARKILFSNQDWAKDRGNFFSNGSWETLAPLSNIVNNIRPQVVAQSVDNTEASTQFVLDLGASRSVGIIYFSNLITDPACTMQIRFTSDPATVVYDSGIVNAWATDVGGILDEEEVISLGRTRVFVPKIPVVGRYLWVWFSQTSATLPVRLGSLNVCSIFEPTYPHEIGGSFTIVDNSDINRLAYGSLHITERGKWMRFNFGLPVLTQNEAFRTFLRLARARGKSKPIIVCEYPDDFNPIVGLERLSIYGVMTNDSVLNNPKFGLYSQVFSIDQLV